MFITDSCEGWCEVKRQSPPCWNWMRGGNTVPSLMQSSGITLSIDTLLWKFFFPLKRIEWSRLVPVGENALAHSFKPWMGAYFQNQRVTSYNNLLNRRSAWSSYQNRVHWSCYNIMWQILTCYMCVVMAILIFSLKYL